MDPNYTQVTVYLRKNANQTARKFLIDEQRQFSDLVDELVSQWIDSQKSERLTSRRVRPAYAPDPLDVPSSQRALHLQLCICYA